MAQNDAGPRTNEAFIYLAWPTGCGAQRECGNDGGSNWILIRTNDCCPTLSLFHTFPC